MNKKKTLIFLVALVIVGLWINYYLQHKEENLFYEKFGSPLGWDKQCTRVDGLNGNLIIPSMAKEFKAIDLKSEDGMLHLYTGKAEHTGGGEWGKQVDIKVGGRTGLEWAWACHDQGNYQFWIKIKFNNNRLIYYKAGDSKQPGFYRGERYIPYKGEKYRDREGRLRFFPSSTILVGIPQNMWVTCSRTIVDDYKQSYGDLPDELRITEISTGMMDDSKKNINEMGIEYVKIFN